MTNKKKIKARKMAEKTGMTYAESMNVLNKNKNFAGDKSPLSLIIQLKKGTKSTIHDVALYFVDAKDSLTNPTQWYQWHVSAFSLFTKASEVFVKTSISSHTGLKWTECNEPDLTGSVCCFIPNYLQNTDVVLNTNIRVFHTKNNCSLQSIEQMTESIIFLQSLSLNFDIEKELSNIEFKLVSDNSNKIQLYGVEVELICDSTGVFIDHNRAKGYRLTTKNIDKFLEHEKIMFKPGDEIDKLTDIIKTHEYLEKNNLLKTATFNIDKIIECIYDNFQNYPENTDFDYRLAKVFEIFSNMIETINKNQSEKIGLGVEVIEQFKNVVNDIENSLKEKYLVDIRDYINIPNIKNHSQNAVFTKIFSYKEKFEHVIKNIDDLKLMFNKHSFRNSHILIIKNINILNKLPKEAVSTYYGLSGCELIEHDLLDDNVFYILWKGTFEKTRPKVCKYIIETELNNEQNVNEYWKNRLNHITGLNHGQCKPLIKLFLPDSLKREDSTFAIPEYDIYGSNPRRETINLIKISDIKTELNFEKFVLSELQKHANSHVINKYNDSYSVCEDPKGVGVNFVVKNKKNFLNKMQDVHTNNVHECSLLKDNEFYVTALEPEHTGVIAYTDNSVGVGVFYPEFTHHFVFEEKNDEFSYTESRDIEVIKDASGNVVNINPISETHITTITAPAKNVTMNDGEILIKNDTLKTHSNFNLLSENWGAVINRSTIEIAIDNVKNGNCKFVNLDKANNYYYSFNHLVDLLKLNIYEPYQFYILNSIYKNLFCAITDKLISANKIIYNNFIQMDSLYFIFVDDIDFIDQNTIVAFNLNNLIKLNNEIERYSKYTSIDLKFILDDKKELLSRNVTCFKSEINLENFVKRDFAGYNAANKLGWDYFEDHQNKRYVAIRINEEGIEETQIFSYE